MEDYSDAGEYVTRQTVEQLSWLLGYDPSEVLTITIRARYLDVEHRTGGVGTPVLVTRHEVR